MASRPQPTLPVERVWFTSRFRRDFGDLTTLIESINELGLLHPIVVRPSGELVAGLRRLAAWKQSSRRDEPIPVQVVDIDAIARGEHAENFCRKELTPSEAVAVMRAILPAQRELGRERQAYLGRHHGSDPDCKFPGGERGHSRDLAAAYTGRSARTLFKAKAVVEAAEAEPERFSRLVEAMDRSGKVDGPYRRLTVMRQAAAIRAEPPPLPQRGPYRVIAADPPWPFDVEDEDPAERGTHPYPQMSYAAIRALDVGTVAHNDAVLWLWTTNFHLRESFSVVDAWGFSPRTMLTWEKDRIGRGHYLREQTEHCILAVRGRPVIELGAESTILHAPWRGHSVKPDSFYDLVERICPAPRYAAIFAHEHRRPGWDAHSTETVEAAEPPTLAIAS